MTTFSSGLFIVFILGIHDINKEPLALALQLGGILISIISLTKGVAEYQNTDGYEKESNWKALASMMFVLPHTLVRVISYSLTAAFLKYYTAIPAATLLITNSIIALSGDGDHFLLVTLLAGLCAPFSMLPGCKDNLTYMRRSLLSTTGCYKLRDRATAGRR